MEQFDFAEARCAILFQIINRPRRCFTRCSPREDM
jgi:hypothetical protein